MIDLLFILMCSTPGVHPETTAAIIHEESRGNEWAIGINEDPVVKKSYSIKEVTSKEKAVTLAQALLKNGYNFDAGLMQINSQNFSKMGLNSESIFDACANIKAGTAILKSFYEISSKKIGPGQEALKAALSAYNTGNHSTGFQNGYVGKFYGKRQKFHENPFQATMNTEKVATKSKKDPYTSSMVVEDEIGEN